MGKHDKYSKEYMLQKQVSEIAKSNRKQKLYSDNNEFLSGLLKTDKLKPIITVVIYFGSKKWDAPRSLHEMLDADEETLKLVDNYHYHLIVPKEIKDFSQFKTDLKYVLQVLKNADNEAAIKDMLMNEESLKNIDLSAAKLLEEVTGIKLSSYINEEGGVNMCKAWEDHAENAAKATLKFVATNMLKAKKEDSEILSMTGLTEEELQVIKEEICELV